MKLFTTFFMHYVICISLLFDYIISLKGKIGKDIPVENDPQQTFIRDFNVIMKNIQLDTKHLNKKTLDRLGLNDPIHDLNKQISKHVFPPDRPGPEAIITEYFFKLKLER